MTRRAHDNTKALDAFIAAKAEIDAMLERLAGPQRRPFRDRPGRDQLGARRHPESLPRQRCAQITDSAFKEGEHAE